MAVPEIAVRFREAVRLTVASLREHPFIGLHYLLRDPRLRNLRSWPVVGFNAVRIYYIPDAGTLRVIRILHQKRDVRDILEQDRAITT